MSSPVYRFGDIWEYSSDRYVVVTTNIGWKRDGCNVMGAGIAKQASERVPGLPLWYGELCKSKGADTSVVVYPDFPPSLILFPTKELNSEQPWMSWQQDSSLPLITRSCRQLANLITRKKFKVVMGYPGCGNGNLSSRKVKPLLDKYLDDNVLVVCKQ